MEQDPQFKRLIRELGAAINDSLSDSERVAQILEEIREAGYDLFLVLELTVGYNRRGETSIIHRERIQADSDNTFQGRLTQQDAAFLKSLRIGSSE